MRALRLRREAVSDLSPADLSSVAGAAASVPWSISCPPPTAISVWTGTWACPTARCTYTCL